MKRMTKKDTVTFGAVGDIALWDRTAEDMLVHGMDWPFEKMVPHLSRAEVLFGNMESVFIPDDYPRDEIDPKGLVSLLPGPEAASALKRAGFDFLNLAANHVLDAGRVGLDHTVRCLEEADILTGGVGYSQAEARRLVVLEKGGLTFGFLCYCEDNNYTLGHTEPAPAYYTRQAVLEDVTAHADEVDVLVVSIHADLEFMPTPSVPRRDAARAVAEAGADLILQHHPHVPQGVEFVNGSLIAYSLGNFVFNAHTSDYMKNNGPHTADATLLLVEVGRDGVHSFERIPARIEEPPEQRPHPLEGRARARQLEYYAELDALLADEAFVKRTWREVARKHLMTYIKRAAERDIDSIMEELVGRLCLVAENRNWMEEILNEAREHWEAQKHLNDPLHRPHYRFQRPDKR